MTNLRRAVEIAKELEFRQKTNLMNSYKPYDYQKKFHGSLAAQRLLMAGNRVGKSFSGAMEMAYHCTGLYPEWWTGKRFNRPVRCWAGGVSNETTRDVCQRELTGQPDDPSAKGTGSIPLKLIGETVRKPGVPNAFNSVVIKHTSGGYSRIGFKAYEMGKEKWMGESLDVIWLDEEPPQSIYSQALTRTADKGGIVYMTFTPEQGMTETVAQFVNNLKTGQELIQATWDDAPHMTKEIRDQILSALPPHERKMREMGIPQLGSGLVFPIAEDDIVCEHFEIPDYFPRICAIDFGWDHPTACTWIAWDRDSDIVYVYDSYAMRQETVPVHASAIKSRGFWIPVVYPMDGRQADKGSGKSLAVQYREEGVNLLREHFTNPPQTGMKEGSGGNSVEAGVMEMLTRFQTKRLKIFENQGKLMEELRMYHRKEGKIVPMNDDVISALRYAVMSLRKARVRNTEPMQLESDSAFNLF
jgi:phage terminase large subunit-like protein|tara:strand:- start:21454 stop:22866 length:1413 start_codon:yes stop_codon:yes gene_type:complete